MAILKLGVTVVGIRGTIGGIIFSGNKAGPYARAWSKGAFPQTLPQTTQRGFFGSIPELWRALSPALQAAWDTFAALPAQELFNSLGESFFASGFNWFQKTNVRLLSMGRATRTAVPVIARPSAPTLTSLELPFLPEQYAKVTYPSGEFPAGQDLVGEVAVSISDGKQVAPPTFLFLMQEQDPNDTETGFLIPYNTRLNLVGSARKGYCRMYRQTSEGLRSGPGSATFVSSDAPAFAANANDYDGATNYGLRGADLTGNADSKLLLLSIWFRIDGGDGTARSLYNNTGSKCALTLRTNNRLRLRLENGAGAAILIHDSTTAFTASAPWHNVIIAVDLDVPSSEMVIDGIPHPGTLVTGPLDDTIDYTVGNYSFGATTAAADLFDGCLAEAYLNNAETLDITNPNNIALFISAALKPQDLGPDGNFPTGNQPIIYFNDADPSANLGSGGNYVNNAALVACSSDP